MKWHDFKQQVEFMGLRDDDEVVEINWSASHTFSGLELHRMDDDNFINRPLVEGVPRTVAITNESY